MTAYNDVAVNGQKVKFARRFLLPFSCHGNQPGIPKPFSIPAHSGSTTTTYWQALTYVMAEQETRHVDISFSSKGQRSKGKVK